MSSLRKLGLALIDIYVLLFAKKYFYFMHNFLFKISLKGMGILNFRGKTISGEKNFIEKQLSNLIGGDPQIIFDVGANIGLYSKMLSERFPNSSIYCFEPNPNCIKSLNSNTPSSCKVFNFGLGDETGELILYDKANSHGSSHASLYKEALDDFHGCDSVKVPVKIIKLDDFAMENGIDKIDFLKIDTEGHELEVLKGAKNLIEDRRVQCIQFEFNSLHIYSRVFLHDFANFLENYTLYRLLPNGLNKVDLQSTNAEIFAFQNIVCLLNSNFYE